MAKQVAAALQVPHIELDVLHWLPEWQERPDSEFRELGQFGGGGGALGRRRQLQHGPRHRVAAGHHSSLAESFFPVSLLEGALQNRHPQLRPPNHLLRKQGIDQAGLLQPGFDDSVGD